MASRDLINLGTAPDSGTGDSARFGGQKINNIFADIYTQFGENPIGNDPTLPYYGYRRSFTEWEYKVGELHPAGRWPTVFFKTPINNDSDRLFTEGWGYGVDNAGNFIDTNGNGVPDIYEDSEWYFLSRGEQSSLDLSEVDDNNSVHVVLPLAKEGDIVKIRDVKGTWYHKAINVWTTPYEFVSDAQLLEWSNATPECTLGYPDSEAIGIVDRTAKLQSCSYKRVDTATSNPNISAEFKIAGGTNRFSPVYFQNIGEAEIQFLYTGPDKGWVYNLRFYRSAEQIVNVLQDYFEENDWIEWTAPDLVQDGQTEISTGDYILPIAIRPDMDEIFRAGSTPNFKVYRRMSQDLTDTTAIDDINSFLQSVVITNRANYNGDQLKRAEVAWGRDQTGVNPGDPSPYIGFADMNIDTVYKEITISNICDVSGNIILISTQPFVGYSNIFIPESNV